MSENLESAVSGNDPEGELLAIIGGFGTGKSLLLVERFYDAYLDGYRHFITNAPLRVELCQAAMPGAVFQVVSNDVICHFWRGNPRRCVIGIDEAQLVYKARKWQTLLKEKDLEEYFSQPRKEGDRIYLVTQRFKDLPAFLRDRVQVAHRVWKVFPRPRIFARIIFNYEEGKKGVAQSWFPRLVPFAVVRKFAKLYDTRAKVGGEAARVAAEFEESRRGGIPRWVFVAVAIGAALAIGWKHRSGGVAKIAEQLAGVQKPVEKKKSVASSNAAAGVRGPLKRFAEWDGIGYVPGPGETLLSVEDDVVVFGDEHGGMRRVPRDFAAEYKTVRSQVKTVGGGQPSVSSPITGGTGGGPGLGDFAGNSRVLPGNGVR
jgi:hypothetical protein